MTHTLIIRRRAVKVERREIGRGSAPDARLLSWSGAKAAARPKFELSLSGKNHQNLSDCSKRSIAAEVSRLPSPAVERRPTAAPKLAINRVFNAKPDDNSNHIKVLDGWPTRRPIAAEVSRLLDGGPIYGFRGN